MRQCGPHGCVWYVAVWRGKGQGANPPPSPLGPVCGLAGGTGQKDLEQWYQGSMRLEKDSAFGV